MKRTLLIFCMFITSCGFMKSNDSSDEIPSGKDLYMKQIPGEESTFTCAACHALKEPTEDGIRHPGHQIGDAFNRPNWKNGQTKVLLDAVNSCLEDWIGADPWAETDQRWVNLSQYLEAQAGEKDAAAISFEIVDPPTELSGGSITDGHELFNISCAICHGMDAAGGTMGPNIAGTTLSAEKIAERVRKSGLTDSKYYEGLTGGRMPFWAKDRLSDTELINLIAYLESTETTATNASGNFPEGALGKNISADSSQGDCDSNHALVGTEKALSTIAHDVSGTLKIIDNCTIQIQNFTFDGNGIDVRIYAGKNGDYSDGPALSADIYTPGVGFDNENVYFKLPTGTSLDDFDGISVWCVAATTSFGDAKFN